MKAFADAVGLGMLDFDLGMMIVVDNRKQLVVVLIRSVTIFRASVCQNAQYG